MSDGNSELDEMHFSTDFYSELESAETLSTVSLSPVRHQDVHVSAVTRSSPANITLNLVRREMGFSFLKPIRGTCLKSYHLSHIFPQQILLTHVFLGMTKCGRFLITYTMIIDQDDEEWYATVYKYRLHWWNFKPGGQARKIAEVSLFGNHKIVEPLQMYVCQWPRDYEKVLVYGLIRECSSVDISGSSNNRHAFVTVTALPSLNDCQDCRVVASSYMLDDIAASWDTCLRFSCLKHGYTVHTSFDVVVPYPEFSPKISLKCSDYAVFNANNFLYALRITLGNCDKKAKDEVEEIPYPLSLMHRSHESNLVPDEFVPSSSVGQIFHPSSSTKALKLKEQIIRDFSEEVSINATVPSRRHFRSDEGEPSPCEQHPCKCAGYGPGCGPVHDPRNHIASPPLPTRLNITRIRKEEHVTMTLTECSDVTRVNFDIPYEKSDEAAGGSKKCDSVVDRDCFRCPMSPGLAKRTREKKMATSEKVRVADVFKSENNNCTNKCCKSFFTRHKVQKGNLNFGLFIRNLPFSKTTVKPTKSVAENPVLDASRHRFVTMESVDSPYEFVDDAQHEVEKLSQFRKKRLAEKKYEFQDFDSENIVPFSTVRQENTLRSPKKCVEPGQEVTGPRKGLNIELRFGSEGVGSAEMNEAILRSPSPRYPQLDLSISVPSPKSPLIIEILPSPTQCESQGVLRPFNRNPGSNAASTMLSPMTKFLSSPPPPPPPSAVAQKPKTSSKSRGCEDVKLIKIASASASATSTSSNANWSKTPSTLDTRIILEKGILINDISEWYFKEDIYNEEENVYRNLFRNLNKFHGEAVRFERRFVDVDDELVSVITDIEDDDTSAVTGYHTALNVEVHGAGYSQLHMVSNSKAEKMAAPCVVVDQQSLDIEAICHSVATTLCQVSNKTFTFCNDYDIEILDVCPRSGDVLILLMMRIEGAEGIRDEVSDLEQYEACVTLVWNLHTSKYKVCMVVPPQKMNWAWNSKAVWNPAKEASKRFKMVLPADVTFCEPPVRVCGNDSTLRGMSLVRIEDLENGVQFIL